VKRCFVILILLALPLWICSSALAENNLQIISAQQIEGKLVFYILLTDAVTGDIVDYDPSASDICARMGTNDNTQTVSIQRFADTGEGVAYAVLLDMNTYVLADLGLKGYQTIMQRFITALHDIDCMRIYTIGKSGAKLLTNDFEYDRLKLSDIITDDVKIDDKATKTKLYQSIARAIGAFSSTVDNFPQRKVLLVITYGADNDSLALDVLDNKASVSGIPIYFIILSGYDNDNKYNIRSADTTELDSIALSSHGRTLVGSDLKTSVEKFMSYMAKTLVLTVSPSDKAWEELSTNWSVHVTLEGKKVTNDIDGNYHINLIPTPLPEPIPGPTLVPIPDLIPEPTPMLSRYVSITWEDNDDKAGLRPDSVYASLYADNEPKGGPVLLAADNHWWGTWNSLQNGIDYTVNISDLKDYIVETNGVDDQGVFRVTASIKKEGNVEDYQTLSVGIIWDDEGNTNSIHLDSMIISLYRNGEDTGKKLFLTSDMDWKGSLNIIKDEAHYSIQIMKVSGYIFTTEFYENGNIFVVVATSTNVPNNEIIWYLLLSISCIAIIMLILKNVELRKKINENKSKQSTDAAKCQKVEEPSNLIYRNDTASSNQNTEEISYSSTSEQKNTDNDHNPEV
jgi:hypothetical protein